MSLLGLSSCFHRAAKELLHQHKGQQPVAERPPHAECPSRLPISLLRAELLPATSDLHGESLAGPVCAIRGSEHQAALHSHF